MTKKENKEMTKNSDNQAQDVPQETPVAKWVQTIEGDSIRLDRIAMVAMRRQFPEADPLLFEVFVSLGDGSKSHVAFVGIEEDAIQFANAIRMAV